LPFPANNLRNFANGGAGHASKKDLIADEEIG
jgi:hypothetical protein